MQQSHQPSGLPCSPMVGVIIPHCFYSPYLNLLEVSAYQTSLANQPRHSEPFNSAVDYHRNMPPPLECLHYNAYIYTANDVRCSAQLLPLLSVHLQAGLWQLSIKLCCFSLVSFSLQSDQDSDFSLSRFI